MFFVPTNTTLCLLKQRNVKTHFTKAQVLAVIKRNALFILW